MATTILYCLKAVMGSYFIFVRIFFHLQINKQSLNLLLSNIMNLILRGPLEYRNKEPIYEFLEAQMQVQQKMLHFVMTNFCSNLGPIDKLKYDFYIEQSPFAAA
ncbi:hypothetical protein BpHYR1_001004 [Brachionus plicatilis]|uniref:Uncharacterized protein n=1 Tax=Brachionus plicatilis TaxID=10195 RepID=A0A3M7PBF6_BRAPC|nr:hypothetical protein BpHYR1_001004 [Brachionus plicatilis]